MQLTKMVLLTILLVFVANGLFAQLDFERNFFKDQFHLDNMRISKAEAQQKLQLNPLSNEYLIEAKRNDLISNISWGIAGVTLLVGVIESANKEIGEPYSDLYYTSSTFNTISIITALITNAKGKKRYKKAVAAYNATNNKTASMTRPKLILMPNKVGLTVRF